MFQRHCSVRLNYMGMSMSLPNSAGENKHLSYESKINFVTTQLNVLKLLSVAETRMLI